MFQFKKWHKGLSILLILFLLIPLTGCKSNETKTPADSSVQSISEAGNNIVQVEKGLSYSGKNEVAAYIHQFQELPPNYITKNEAQELGWDNSEGNLWEVTDRKSIGGDHFGNREGLLPKTDTRQYYECDVSYRGGYRGSERIVYSNDGLIFYTDDHYQGFERLY